MPRKSNKQELTCVACNKTYYKSPSKAKGSKYCSRICMNTTQALANKKERIEVKCEYCNDIF
jgi:redox-regulated HSP33 family molecular chaperone